MIFPGVLTFPENQDRHKDYKYYWRVVIGRRDLKGPLFEIAGFMDEEKADEFMKELVAKEDWDNDILYTTRLLYALAPYYVSDADLLSAKIEYLLKVK